MEGKIVKKSVPNEPIVRQKNAPISEEIIIEAGEEQNKDLTEDQPKLKGARNRIKRNQPFTMNANNGTSKSEKTVTKPDGTIIRTIVEINGNKKKTTVITTKGGSTQTNTRIETIGGGAFSSNNNKGNDGFGFGRMDSDFDSGFGNFDKMWQERVNQMNDFYNNFGNFGINNNNNKKNEKSYHYEYSSSSGTNNNGVNNTNNINNNKKKETKWEYDKGFNFNFDDNNNKGKNKNNDWDIDWGTGNNNNNKNNKKNDDWDIDWGAGTNNKKEEKTPSISGSEFQNSALDAHNNYRAKHHVGKLVLDKELCEIAQKYAEQLARTGNFAHSHNKFHGDNMGENLFACYGMRINGKMMTDDWYNEVNQYDFNNPGYISGTGHFTQIVWKDSKRVGFGYAQARDGYYYGVANYYPAGNFIGEFDQNVFRA